MIKKHQAMSANSFQKYVNRYLILVVTTTTKVKKSGGHDHHY